MGYVQMLFDQTGCGELNIAAFKPEIPIYQLPGEIETKFQRLNLYFRGKALEHLGLEQILSDKTDCCKSIKVDLENQIWCHNILVITFIISH